MSKNQEGTHLKSKQMKRFKSQYTLDTQQSQERIQMMIGNLKSVGYDFQFKSINREKQKLKGKYLRWLTHLKFECLQCIPYLQYKLKKQKEYNIKKQIVNKWTSNSGTYQICYKMVQLKEKQFKNKLHPFLIEFQVRIYGMACKECYQIQNQFQYKNAQIYQSQQWRMQDKFRNFLFKYFPRPRDKIPIQIIQSSNSEQQNSDENIKSAIKSTIIQPVTTSNKLSSSNKPSVSSSVNPSKDNPSNNPSVNISNNSSVNPSNNPSVNPSNNPSVNISNNSSVNPSNNPSVNISNNSSVNPSNNPSVNPANNPSVNINVNVIGTPIVIIKQQNNFPSSNQINTPNNDLYYYDYSYTPQFLEYQFKNLFQKINQINHNSFEVKINTKNMKGPNIKVFMRIFYINLTCCPGYIPKRWDNIVGKIIIKYDIKKRLTNKVNPTKQFQIYYNVQIQQVKCQKCRQKVVPNIWQEELHRLKSQFQNQFNKTFQYQKNKKNYNKPHLTKLCQACEHNVCVSAPKIEKYNYNEEQYEQDQDYY